MKYSDKYRNWFDRDDLVADLMIEAADDIDERDAEIEKLRGLVHHAFCEGQITRVQWDDWKNSEVYAALKGD